MQMGRWFGYRPRYPRPRPALRSDATCRRRGARSIDRHDRSRPSFGTRRISATTRKFRASRRTAPRRRWMFRRSSTDALPCIGKPVRTRCTNAELTEQGEGGEDVVDFASKANAGDAKSTSAGRCAAAVNAATRDGDYIVMGILGHGCPLRGWLDRPALSKSSASSAGRTTSRSLPTCVHAQSVPKEPQGLGGHPGPGDRLRAFANGRRRALRIMRRYRRSGLLWPHSPFPRPISVTRACRVPASMMR